MDLRYGLTLLPVIVALQFCGTARAEDVSVGREIMQCTRGMELLFEEGESHTVYELVEYCVDNYNESTVDKKVAPVARLAAAGWREYMSCLEGGKASVPCQKQAITFLGEVAAELKKIIDKKGKEREANTQGTTTL